MATKLIYFIVGGHNERAEFSSNDSVEDIRELFRSAAEAADSDILKLYNVQGSIVNISPHLPPNTPETPYRLQVVASIPKNSDKSSVPNSNKSLIELENRLQNLQSQVMSASRDSPDKLLHLNNKIDLLREKLENFGLFSWMGLHKELTNKNNSNHISRVNNNKKSAETCVKIFDKVKQLSHVQLTLEARESLKKADFNNWQWEDAEMIILMRQMFIDLNLLNKFNIEMDVLMNWLFTVYGKYNDVPFHNFKHCFMVSQMMYSLIWLIDLQKILEDFDILVLIISAISHDLDHPGYNNAYQINARTDLAMTYNDISPLENHHCSVAFEILLTHDCNILRNIDQAVYRKVREAVIRCILATDMSRHQEILTSFKSIIPTFDLGKPEHKNIEGHLALKNLPHSQHIYKLFSGLLGKTRLLSLTGNNGNKTLVCVLMMILIKVADISNECRPKEVSEPWLDCLLEEYFLQGDTEKVQGLPVAPFMDREKASRVSSQTGFIKFILLPLFESLGELYPVVVPDVVEPVRNSYQYYDDLQKSLDLEKKPAEEKTKTTNAVVKNENRLDGLKPLKVKPVEHSGDLTVTKHIIAWNPKSVKESTLAEASSSAT